ncbi:MFS transporter [Comamonas serinivorans]|uniref:MFS transporter n=1 Tax=Comamonas serinivorans TaxID=1082851 RepID=A0A1Y0ELJ0_9BURK|nr:MFS transporter [Comamonas serinivorans]ARU04515.1 MFS transporter [Comamonas serinivorans]
MPVPTTAPLAWPRAPSSSRALALALLLAGTLMVTLDFFIVNVMLPALQHELKASNAALQWVVAGYGLGNAAGLVTGGRLGDLYGRRRLYALGIAAFSLASLACGLAPDGPTLVAARVAQGLAGALIQPQVLAMLGELFTGERRAKAYAAYGVVLGLGAALGQVLGALLMQWNPAGLGWRACFLINLPVGLVVLALLRRGLPALPGSGQARLDGMGAGGVGLLITLVLLPLVQGREHGWPAWTWVCLALVVPGLVILLRQQRALASRGGHPVLPPSLLAAPSFGLGLGMTLAFYAGNAAFYFVLTQFLQEGLGLSALAGAAVFGAMAGVFFLASLAAPALSRRLGHPPIGWGALILAGGHALGIAAVLTPWPGGVHSLWPSLLLQGLGLGLVMAPLVSAVLAGLPPQHAGVAAGVLASTQQLGNALGVALIGVLFFAAPVRAGYAAGLAYLGLLAVGVALLYRVWARPRPGQPA